MFPPLSTPPLPSSFSTPCTFPIYAEWVPAATGAPAAPHLYPSLQIEPGEAVLFKAIELKHNLHPDVMTIIRKDGPLCPIQRLHTLLAQSSALYHPARTNFSSAA